MRLSHARLGSAAVSRSANQSHERRAWMPPHIAATWESLANDRIKTAEGLERIAKLEKTARKSRLGIRMLTQIGLRRDHV